MQVKQKNEVVQNKTAELSIIHRNSDSLMAKVKSLRITDTDENNNAIKMVVEIVSHKKRVEELRQFFVKPLNDQVSAINAEFKNASMPLMEMEKIIKTEMVRYSDEEARKLAIARKKQEEKDRIKFEKEKAKRDAELLKQKEAGEISTKELKEAQREIKKDEFEFDDSDFQQSKTVHTSAGSVQMKTVIDFEVINPSDVPREFLIVDERLIRKVVASGVRVIKGVNIFEKKVPNISL